MNNLAMEQKNFHYSMKNIPLASKAQYTKKLIEKVSNVITRMRWAAIHYLKPTKKRQKETYGFKTLTPPDAVELMEQFENDLCDLITDIEFKKHKSAFQQQLKNDVSDIKSSNEVFVHADKSTNLYKVSKNLYEKMLNDNVTKTYMKARDNLKHEIDMEGKSVAYKLEIADRMEIFAEKEPFVTLKDHKPNFTSKPTNRLLVPSKSEIGIPSQQMLKRINAQLRDKTQVNQWQNTQSVIDWFNNLKDKKKRTFIQFDIESFYPSITEETLLKSIEWAKTHVHISDLEIETILHARRSLLFFNGSTWIKKDGTDFDVTMGSYDGAEICELVGLYLLHLLSQRFNKEDTGLYRDDGAMASILTKREADKARKDLIKIFKSCGFTITVEINLPQMNMLDVTFDLPSEKYWPYRKPNNEPLYVHSQSNHPPVIIKHLPKNITHRLSSISCDKEQFDKAKPDYENALKNSGFDGNMEFIEPQRKQRRKPRQNIIWFNPPFDLQVKTNVARKFLQLIDTHFHERHPLHKIFNRNKVKVSYSTMNNMASIISSHNKKILNGSSTGIDRCNCRKFECPLNGNCLVESIIYRADVTAKDKPAKVYFGMSEPDFKGRFRDHKSSITNDTRLNRKKTTLSKYIWRLRDEGVPDSDIKVKYSIHKKSSKYKCGTRRCDLCLSDKHAIATAERSYLLNKRSELLTGCIHRHRYLYTKVKPPEPDPKVRKTGP